MSAFVVAFMFAAGVGTWVYAKLARTSGESNQRNAIIGGFITAAIAFLVFYSLLDMFTN
jgi:hypothetical protein